MMTKPEALKYFKSVYSDFLAEKEGDRLAKWEQWSFYTDMLHKEGKISDYQVNNWINPYNKKA